MASEVSTIILRFRDLVTDRGQTVAWHQEIIAKSGSVWWGWWRKRGETVPDEIFRDLKVRAKAGGFTAYLMDSGQEFLYRVVCTDVDWDGETLKDKSSPEKSETPLYYNQQKYLAWFQFKEITLVEDAESVLRKFSYLRVDEFFDGGESTYLPFYDKQVYSVGELHQQDRTIWFLRDFNAVTDTTHEVSLLSSRALKPKHFSTAYFQSSSPAVLWVSDTHFSEEHHHGFPMKSGETELNLAARITSSFKDDFPLVAGIIISGDLTWKALPSEFQLVKEFIRELSYWSPLPADQIAVCPGNHDVKFSDDPADKSKPITIFDAKSSEAYAAFYQDKFYLAPNEYLSCGRRFLLGNSVPVDIVCLNSSRLQQLEGAFQGHGFIGDKQMEDAAKQMNWVANSEAPRAYRIVVLHHHLLPTTFRFKAEANYAYSVVLDAEALSRWIAKHRVDLVLHGHMHQPFCARVSRPIDINEPQNEPWHEFTVIGMGSSGVAKKDLGEVELNTVGFLEFELDKLEISVHSVHPVNPSKLIWKIDLPYRQKMYR